jgi:hypothetical protein
MLHRRFILAFDFIFCKITIYLNSPSLKTRLLVDGTKLPKVFLKTSVKDRKKR